MAARRKDSGDPAFPSWIGLLRRAARELRDEQKGAQGAYVESCLDLDEPKVLEAAQTAQDALQAGWSDFLVRVFRLQRKELNDESLECARLLWKLGSKLVITTNFDNIIEWSLPVKSPIIWKIENAHGHAQFMRGEHSYPTVWHLHGHIDEPDRTHPNTGRIHIVVWKPSRKSQYEAALTTVRNIISSYTILFVGFSLQDQSVNAQLNWLEHTFQGQAGRHFALLRRDEIPLFRARGALKNVEPISYEEHGEPLLVCLREMASIADPDFRGSSDRNSERHGSMTPVISAPEVDWPAELGLEMPESFLLRPEKCIVPFHGFRQPLLQEVLDWALAEQPRVALRLEVGPGGSGKTRLMIEASRLLKAEHGWESTFLFQRARCPPDRRNLIGFGQQLHRHCGLRRDEAGRRCRARPRGTWRPMQG